jgi:hypothetical protein
MSSTYRLTLRQKAILTWYHERPMKKAARIEQQIRLLETVRQKMVQMFSSEYEIKVGIIDNQRIGAIVGDVRFRTFIYGENLIIVTPVERCSYCKKDTLLGAINDLAELGEALEEFELGIRHQCNSLRGKEDF